MRDILFRGKRDNGEWVIGNLFVPDKEDTPTQICIGTNIVRICYDVDPKTVGQYTGYADKNGTKIFEGDIIQTRRYETYQEELKGYYGYDSEGYPQKVPGYTGSMMVTRTRVNDDYLAEVVFSNRYGFTLSGTSTFVNAIDNVVVGNIHDNPELLKKGTT